VAYTAGHLARIADASAVRDVGHSVVHCEAPCRELGHGFLPSASVDASESQAARKDLSLPQAAHPLVVNQVAADELSEARPVADGPQSAVRALAKLVVRQAKPLVSAQQLVPREVGSSQALPLPVPLEQLEPASVLAKER